MKIPTSFKTAIEKREEKGKKERLKERQTEKQYQQKLKKHQEDEQASFNSKMENCNKIFAWKKEFLKSEEGERVFKKSGKNLWVFIGNWGHEVPRYGGNGCWARLYFNQRAIEYWAGYKWVGGGPRFNFTKPGEMAKKLSYDYIQKFLTEIETGKVFKTILKLNRD